MLKKIFTTTTILLLLAAVSIAQTAPKIIFSRMTKTEGLASNTTFQTIRDKQGFLWIATQNGLQRYDGTRFMTFRHLPGDSTSIPENGLSHLFIDSKERLWLLFDKKIGIFNTSEFRFTETKITVPVNIVKKVMEDPQGQLILFADSKQFLYDEAKHAFSAPYPLPALPAGYTIGDLAIDATSGLYWFTGKQGSLLYDPKTKQFSSKEQNTTHTPGLDSIGGIKNARYPFIAKDGTWWMVNWIPFMGPAPTLYSYNKTTNKVLQFEKIRAYKADSYYEIWGVFQQDNGMIWIYGMGLLAYYDTTTQRFIHINSDPFQQNGIDYDMVSALYEDKEKNVWVSTNNGLYRFNTDAQVFRNLNNRRAADTASVPNAVSSVVQGENNEIWVSTWGAGVFSYNSQLQPVANPVTDANAANKNLHISAMTRRRNGEIWMGLQTGEIRIYNPAEKQTSSVAYSLLKGEIIQQLFEDRQGNTWIGSNSGLLIKCEGSNWKDSTRSFKKMLSDAGDIFKLYQDNKGFLWICTASTGVYKMDINTGKVVQQFMETAGKNNGLLNDGATDIVQYNDSLYLIASDGLCILNSRDNTFRYLTAAEGLPAEHITALVVDKKNRLWVACDGGLYRLNIDSKLFITYTAADGITSDVFQVSSATLLQDGRIAIGTIHDFLVFDPEKTIDQKAVPPVVVTGIAIGSNYLSIDSLQKQQELVLSYDNTFVTIELSTLSFRDRYYMYYMLEGLDKTWKRVYNNEIVYQYLPSGSYTLKLKSKNGEGTETETVTSLRIYVHAPFWKTWWFYVLVALLAGAVLFWLDHSRIKRKAAIFKMRSNIADDLYKDINQALSGITILSEMARIKAGREPEKSKEFIDQIHTKSQNMTLAMDDILWSIDPDNDNMQNFISRLKEYVNTLCHQYNVKIELIADKRSSKLPVNMSVRNDVYWLFKGGITNVVRAGACNCHIHIRFEKPNLIYKLRFDTAAIDMDQLHSLRQRGDLTEKLKKLRAKLDFNEQEGEGVFVLSIPVGGV